MILFLENINNLKKLKFLHVANNSISTLPSNLVQIDCLKSIKLIGNPLLESFPEELQTKEEITVQMLQDLVKK